MNLLAVSENYINVAVDGIGTIDLPWLGNIIKWLFDLFTGVPGAIALGAIVFTLALKTLVLPLDIYSRVKMKKQSLLMKSMRPQMEKLQHQYANDKTMYNQKVMELQRANGYNPLSACLPTIVSLVIFMVVFSAFSQYSAYANLSQYNNLTVAYSAAVQEYVYDDISQDVSEDKLFLTAFDDDDKQIIHNGTDTTDTKVKGYKIDFDKFGRYYASIKAQAGVLPESWTTRWGETDFDALTSEADKNEMVISFVQLRAREAAAKYYVDHKPATSFLWIGNVWYPDSMFNKELPSFSDFRSQISRAAGSIDANYEESYNEVTANLSVQRDTYNGYFVLIVLAIGFMFLQQFITMRAQKDANELSSVDGSGARTNKMMMIMMPIIFGIFSFFYSAAFSIYMIINTAYSFLVTLVINKLVTVRFENKQEKEALNKRAGRKRLK